jgi:glutamate---cysteine ligase / carboxylate-amine ligase
MAGVRKVGVEEELLLVEPESGELANAAGHVLHEHRSERHDVPPPTSSHDLEGELLRHMLETHTDPATDLRETVRQLREARRTALVAAEESGLAVVAVGTAPLGSVEPAVSVNPRYERIANEFGGTGRGAGTLGMHVHVDIADEDEGVRVIDRLRPWLPLLTAISANSPYASGKDTGYASWRQQVLTRWPTAGPAEPYGSAAEYHRVTRALIDIGAALDAGMLYFDARLSAKYPTVEIRVADTCTDVDDALVVVALARALVETCAAADPPTEPWRTDLLRGAWWRAARYGLSGHLVHPVTAVRVEAREAIASLREAVDDALRRTGDVALVDDGLARLSATGTGARRQRAAYERTGGLRGVVADLVARTADSVERPAG